MITMAQRQKHPDDSSDKFDDEKSHDDEDSVGAPSSSDYSSYSGTSSQFTDTNPNSDVNKSDSSADGIAGEGRAAVMGSKALVLFVLAIATASVGYATYNSTSGAEENTFKDQVSYLVQLVVFVAVNSRYSLLSSWLSS